MRSAVIVRLDVEFQAYEIPGMRKQVVAQLEGARRGVRTDGNVAHVLLEYRNGIVDDRLHFRVESLDAGIRAADQHGGLRVNSVAKGLSLLLPGGSVYHDLLVERQSGLGRSRGQGGRLRCRDSARHCAKQAGAGNTGQKKAGGQ